MKKLDELGISPAPWFVDESEYGDRNNVICNYVCDKISKGEVRTKILAHTNYHFDNSQADARLIATAPELYEALREAVVEFCHECQDTKIENCRGKCFVASWRDVLAKAAGESEVEVQHD